MTSSAADLCKLACCGLLDGFFMHADLLSQAAWASHLTLLDHLIVKVVNPQLQEAAVAAAGRLLLQLPENCADQGSTEQLLDMLVTLHNRHSSGSLAAGRGTDQGDAAGLLDAKSIVKCFFRMYPQGHAEQLANTCVYIICKAAHSEEVLYEPGHGIYIGDTAVELQASITFLLDMLQDADLPEDVIWLAVCANLEDKWPDVQPVQVCNAFAAGPTIITA